MTIINYKSINVSIVIPTRNRPNDLKVLLNSILVQAVLPTEIIVVDESSDDKTKNLVEYIRSEFLDKKVRIKYLRGGEEGVAQKRNIGLSHAIGDICLFLDDDIIIDKNYIKKILEVYEKHPNALGVGGYIITEALPFSALSNSIKRVLFVFHFTSDACRVRPLGISLPYPLTKIINCGWLNGGTASYKREIFKDFRWDENLKAYSISEDKDLSYRICKRYPNSLFMTPYAKAIHTKSTAARLSNKYVIYMGVAHSAYVFYKNFKQTLQNNVFFVWGLFFGHLIHQVLTKNPNNVIFQIGAYLNLLKNLREIKKGNFASLESIACA